ncbi:MAG: hypothetical protein LC808_24540 [Actinobacteria bacterium]|nr:hypothetical protein [Actinomycetota bacterium]
MELKLILFGTGAILFWIWVAAGLVAIFAGHSEQRADALRMFKLILSLLTPYAGAGIAIKLYEVGLL